MAKTTTKPSKPAANTGFNKTMSISPELAAVIGVEPVSRTEVTKKLWIYIKKNNLQNPKKKTEIVADDHLKKVFGGKAKVSMFEMTRLVGKHLS